MIDFKNAFNHVFWQDSVYRSPYYKDMYDDSGQALAVVAGLADTDKYKAILKILLKEEHTSPYMEKYVFEAMMLMGYEKEALERHKKRYLDMVENDQYSTFFEGWKPPGSPMDIGGGTPNHAWSGGGVIVLSQYLCGISPIKPVYELFSILPQPGTLKSSSIIGKPPINYTKLSNFSAGV